MIELSDISDFLKFQINLNDIPVAESLKQHEFD